MNKVDITSLVKSLQSAKTLEDQRKAVMEITKLVNARTSEEIETEKAGAEQRFKERLATVNRKDLVLLSHIKKEFDKSEIQYLKLKTSDHDNNIVISMAVPHIRDIAMTIGKHDQKSWSKLDEETQKSLIDKASPILKKLREKSGPILHKLQAKSGFTGRRISTRIQSGSISHTTTFTKDYDSK